VRIFIIVTCVLVTTLSLNAARAFPYGAPWGAANPAAEQHCASCHFDNDPVHESSLLVIHGLPRWPAPGAIYELEIILEDPDTIVAGLQLMARASDEPAGTFISSDADVEFIGASIRSTVPVRSNDGVSWVLKWHAPAVVVSPVIFYVAAVAANDDRSPFGDTVHFRSYKLASDL
jgi:hypothetical protein